MNTLFTYNVDSLSFDERSKGTFNKSYVKALQNMFFPYPSEEELKEAEDILIDIYEKDKKKASFLLVLLQYLKPNGHANQTVISTAYEENKNHSDKFLSYALGMLFIRSPTTVIRNQVGRELMNYAYQDRLADAAYTIGIMTYYGLYWCARDPRKSVPIFLQAAKEKYLPAMYQAGIMLLSGDGADADCEGAYKFLHAVCESIPSIQIIKRYAEAGNFHAYLKLIDLGFLPPHVMNGTTKTDIHTKQKLSFKNNMLNFSEDIYKRILQAESGDIFQMMYLATHTNIEVGYSYVREIIENNKSYKLISFILNAIVTIAYVFDKKYQDEYTREMRTYLYNGFVEYFRIGCLFIIFICVFCYRIKKIWKQT